MVDIGVDKETGLLWLPDAEENAVWYKALAAIDRRGDKRPLIKLLRSGRPVPLTITFYIGDLLDRYVLKQPKARPRVPAYMRTAEQAKLIAAVVDVHGRVRYDGVLLAVALQQVADETGLPEETLTAAYTGKHGGLQRAQRRWYTFRP